MIAALYTSLGYSALFAVSFLAATLLPLGSEATVAAMGAAAFDPTAVLFVATLGNGLGALLNYGIGRWGGRVAFRRWVASDTGSLASARRFCRKWGAPILFFAWLPVIGDPLTVAAGVLKIRIDAFLFWVVLGKGLRYFLVLKGAQAVMA
jgi:membrane protein YqaA with SNARE-associated domain